MKRTKNRSWLGEHGHLLLNLLGVALGIGLFCGGFRLWMKASFLVWCLADCRRGLKFLLITVGLIGYQILADGFKTLD